MARAAAAARPPAVAGDSVAQAGQAPVPGTMCREISRGSPYAVTLLEKRL
ncbi:hypothetical protein [Streptomyces sp. I05A-00742]|nr:hypothetical protein [Streptomyces sp. I05A-00742]